MRVLLIALLMCLLPVRGWTGTAMAIGMATAQVANAAQHVQIAHDANHTASASTMPADCPTHAGNTDSTDSATNGPTDSGELPCGGCDTCELCVAIASFTAPQFHPMPFSPSTAPAARPHGFFSADRASRLKPPIS